MRRTLIPSLCLLIACASEGDPTPDFVAHPVTITPNSVWAGATVTLRSEAFKVADLEALGLSLDDVALTPVVVDDTTLQVVIPSATMAGAHYLHTALSGAPESLGGMEVYGWSGATSGATPINTDVVLWPVDVPTGVLVGSGASGRVPTYIPADAEGSVISYSGLEVNDGYGISTSYTPGVMIDRTGLVAQLHELDSGWVLLDTVSAHSRNLYELSPGVWLQTGSHYSDVYNDTIPGSDTVLTTESPWLLVRNAASNRATFVISAATPALPILSATTGMVTASVSGVVGSVAAAFSPDGSDLFLAGGPSWAGPLSILRVDPTTGAILAKDSVHVGGYALATHGSLPDLVFELDQAADHTWLLRIRNADDLSIVAELGSNTQDDGCVGAPNALIIDGGTTARAFISRCSLGYRVVNWELMPGI